MTKRSKAMGLAAALAGLGFWVVSGRRRVELDGKVALVFGGSRGLGLLIARELSRKGCRLALAARDVAELDRAVHSLKDLGAEAIAVRCDVTSRTEVELAVAEVEARLGPVDVLVNDAGIITVAPLESTSETDFERAMGVMFWGPYHATMAALPSMKRRGGGSIVNIASIGGKVSVPHLLPYGSAKFALVGLSQGLRAELARHGVRVTTVVPWLMRTGSHLNAEFAGDRSAEYAWFSLGATLPLVSMDAERAAEKIVRAMERGQAELILTPWGKLATAAAGLFPGLVANLMGLVNRHVLPPPGDASTSAPGREARSDGRGRLARALDRLGDRAAARFNENPGPTEAGLRS